MQRSSRHDRGGAAQEGMRHGEANLEEGGEMGPVNGSAAVLPHLYHQSGAFAPWQQVAVVLMRLKGGRGSTHRRHARVSRRGRSEREEPDPQGSGCKVWEGTPESSP